MDNTEEEAQLLADDPDMAYAFQAQDDVMKLLESWAPKLHDMTDVQRARHWWAAMDCMLCVMYRVMPKERADALIRLIMTEIRRGNG